MECSTCKKLMFEYQRAAMAHLKMVRLRERETGDVPSSERQIWDVILDAAISIREDARRELTTHQTQHGAQSRLEGFLVIVLAQFLELWQLEYGSALTSFRG